MSDLDKHSDDPLERLLEECAIAEPSADLEDRMNVLFGRPSRRWRALVVPVASFAAGLLVAWSIQRLFLQPPAPPPTVAPLSVAPTSAAPTHVMYVADNHQSSEELAGTLGGILVRIKRTRVQIGLSPSPSSNAAAEVVFADYLTVDRAVHY